MIQLSPQKSQAIDSLLAGLPEPIVEGIRLVYAANSAPERNAASATLINAVERQIAGVNQCSS